MAGGQSLDTAGERIVLRRVSTSILTASADTFWEVEAPLPIDQAAFTLLRARNSADQATAEGTALLGIPCCAALLTTASRR